MTKPLSTDNAKQAARELVAQFSHFEDDHEWVTNPSPDKLREAIAIALDRFRLEGQVEEVEYLAEDAPAMAADSDFDAIQEWLSRRAAHLRVALEKP
jgi:hypothetical protein